MLVDGRQASQRVFEQTALRNFAQQGVRQAVYRVVAGAAHDVVGVDLVGMLHAGRLHQLFERVQGVLVEVVDALGLVAHDQGLLAQRVLGGHACGAVAGVSGLRLDAADGKHKAARAIAPVGAQSHQAGNVKGADHFAGAADFDAIAQARAAQSVVHQDEPLLQG